MVYCLYNNDWGRHTEIWWENTFLYKEYTAVEIFTVFDITGPIPLQIIVKTYTCGCVHMQYLMNDWSQISI